MAAITSIDAKTPAAPFQSNPTVLSADDTFTVVAGKTQLLVLHNPTGGSLTATLDGSTGTSVDIPGLGSVDVSGGLAIVVAAGTSKSVVISKVSHYTKGVAHITGAATMLAWLFNIT